MTLSAHPILAGSQFLFDTTPHAESGLLRNKDLDGDGCLDWHPSSLPPHDWRDWDYTGSGAAMELDYGDLANWRAHSIWVAAPAGAYVDEDGWFWTGPGHDGVPYTWDDWWCTRCYLGEGKGRVEIGIYSPVENLFLLPGTRLLPPTWWVTVSEIRYAEGGSVLEYEYHSPYKWGNLKIKGPA